MHPYRVLVILFLFMQVTYTAPLNADHTSAPVLTHITEKKPNTKQMGQKYKRIRKFGYVQIICGIDSFEDDYYGCDVQPELNLMNPENETVLHTIPNNSVAASKTNATRSTSDRVNSTCSTFSPSKSWSQRKSGKNPPNPKTVCESSTQAPQDIHYDVFDESPRTKSKATDVPHHTTRYKPKSNSIFEKQTSKVSELFSHFSPRCLEKTINLKKLTLSPQHHKLFMSMTTSTQIIWVGNTFPVGQTALLDKT